MDIARFYGVYRAVVRSTADPLKQRRVKLSVQTTAGEITDWVPPMEETNTSYDPPSIGQGVWVHFIGGDPDYPIWFGSFGKNKGANKKLFMKALANTENITDVTDLLAVNLAADGTQEIDVVQTLLNLVRNRYYGSFYDSTTQTNPVANTANVISIGGTTSSNGVSITSGTRITFAHTGVYRVSFDVQFMKSGGSSSSIDVWFTKNSVPIANSNQEDNLAGSGDITPMSGFVYVTATTPGDYCEIAWSSADTSVHLMASGTQTGPTRPATPSVLVSVEKVR